MDTGDITALAIIGFAAAICIRGIWSALAGKRDADDWDWTCVRR